MPLVLTALLMYFADTPVASLIWLTAKGIADPFVPLTKLNDSVPLFPATCSVTLLTNAEAGNCRFAVCADVITFTFTGSVVLVPKLAWAICTFEIALLAT